MRQQHDPYRDYYQTLIWLTLPKLAIYLREDYRSLRLKMIKAGLFDKDDRATLLALMLNLAFFNPLSPPGCNQGAPRFHTKNTELFLIQYSRLSGSRQQKYSLAVDLINYRSYCGAPHEPPNLNSYLIQAIREDIQVIRWLHSWGFSYVCSQLAGFGRCFLL